VKDRGWVIDFVFWSVIDSWEMESLPKLIVRSWCCRAVARVVHGTQVGIGKEVDCDVMRVVLLGDFCSQAREGMWGMPGHTEAMKAVVSCEKLGGAAHTR
jgi:hypothetical protein